MRTTLTLDPDVANDIERIRRQRGRSLKQVVNDALRLGLERLDEPARPTRFRTRGVSLGAPSLPLDNVAEALTHAEGEDAR